MATSKLLQEDSDRLQQEDESLILIEPPRITALELKNTKVPLIAGHLYRLQYKVRSNLLQEVQVTLTDRNDANPSLDTIIDVPVNQWNKHTHIFTAVETDDHSILHFFPALFGQEIWFDAFSLIDLTMSKKSYRIMRIQGSLLPGSFVQTLTLREKTTAETA